MDMSRSTEPHGRMEKLEWLLGTLRFFLAKQTQQTMTMRQTKTKTKTKQYNSGALEWCTGVVHWSGALAK